MKAQDAHAKEHGVPVDRYLSPAQIWEASEILSALADRLTATAGVWADDAREDAEHVRLLADTLRSWCPGPLLAGHSPSGGSAGDAAIRHGTDWSRVLGLYLG